MRPIDSSYDRESARGTNAASPLVTRLEAGEIVSYDDIDALIADVGDAAWHEHISPIVVEVPGEGWRLAREEEDES